MKRAAMVAAILLLGAGVSPHLKAEGAQQCEMAKGNDKTWLARLVATPDKCFDLESVPCVNDAPPALQLATDKPIPNDTTFTASCSSGKVSIKADAEKLKALAAKKITLNVGPAKYVATVKANLDTGNGAGAPAAAAAACESVKQGVSGWLGKLVAKSDAACVELEGETCTDDASAPQPKLKEEALAVAGPPFSTSCLNGKVRVHADATKLKPLAAKDITLTVGKTTDTAKLAAADAEPVTETGEKAKGEKEEAPPIDITPEPIGADKPGADADGEEDRSKAWTYTDENIEKAFAPGEGTPGKRYIYVRENLSIDPRSAQFATETDQVVIRFIARKAVLCRYYAQSDDKNEYKPEIGRVGGRDGLKAVIDNWMKVGAGDAGNSCGFDLGGIDNEKGRLKVEASDAKAYAYTDFTFGPFTSDQLTFHLFRHDREFKANDLQNDVKVANHLRYVAWADLMVVGTFLAKDNQVIGVGKQNGTELTRIGVTNQRQQVDIVAQIKFFAWCSNSVNGWFAAQDLNVANACIGLGSGFSLTHPTERFYPLGINLTLGRYLSINALSVLERSKRLASGYSNGDLFSGSADDVPTTERLIFGGGLGVGMDPTLIGDLIGKIIKAGL